MTDERKVAIAPETTCDRLGGLAAAAAPGPSRAPDPRQWASIESRLAMSEPPAGWLSLPRRWLVLAVAGMALVCAVGWLAARRTLPYRVEACAVSADGSLRSLERGLVAFDDGTRVELEPASRLRIKPLAFARGAELVVDEGEVRLAVVRRPHATWWVVAGPFRVHVTGTRFSVRWSESTGRLRIVMTEGEVEVSGGPVRTDTRLRAGQALEAEAGGFVVRDAPPLSPAPAPALPAAEPAPRIAPELGPAPSAEGIPARPAPGKTGPRPPTPARRGSSASQQVAQAELIAPPARGDRAVARSEVEEDLAPDSRLPTAPVASPVPSSPPAGPSPAARWSATQAAPVRVMIAADGQLSGGVTGFAWVDGGEGAEFSMPVAKLGQSRLHATDGQLCAHGRLASWACVNEGTPHLRCNWDRNWGAAIGFFVKRDETAWGAEAASAIAVDFRGRSGNYRLVAHRKGEPANKVFCVDGYKSGRLVEPGQLKSRCWDDAGETLSDFRDVDSFSLQVLSGLEYIAFRYCITGVRLDP